MAQNMIIQRKPTILTLLRSKPGVPFYVKVMFFIKGEPCIMVMRDPDSEWVKWAKERLLEGQDDLPG